MTAVAAFPDFDFRLCKHFRKFDILEQRTVALFMMLFDGGDEAELCGKFGEAFLFGGLCELLIHIRPLVVFARCGGSQIFGRIADAFELLEPELCVLLFIVCRLQKERRDLLVAFLLGNGCKVGVLVPCLRFPRKSRFEVFLGLRACILVVHGFLLSERQFILRKGAVRRLVL